VLATARIVSGKWTLLVLRDLAFGPCRFSELERSLTGISPRTLSQRLKTLEDEGIIERRAFAQSPPRVEYHLTSKGRDLVPIVDAMRGYGERWLDGLAVAHVQATMVAARS
jgi:DNA-binding HxlR family transcriptional regulator